MINTNSSFSHHNNQKKMQTTLGRNLHMCFTKIKRPSSPLSLNPDDDHSHPCPSGTTSSSMLIKNFNSLYDYNNNYSNATFDSTSKTLTLTHSSSEPDSDSDSEPNFATVVASQRFFFTSPGSSNSIIESSPSLATLESSDTQVSMISHADPSLNNLSGESLPKSGNSPTVKDSVAVPTYSPDPYMDFRQSMQEMVDARDLVDVKSNWDYLHELLLCYLALNPKSTHKFIVDAFADLLVSLMSPPEETEGGDRQPPVNVGFHDSTYM